MNLDLSLLREALRQAAIVEPYSEQLIGEVIIFMNQSDEKLISIDPTENAVHQAALSKHKRAALIYLETRTRTLRKILNSINSIPGKFLSRLEEAEKSYCRNYELLRSEYFSQVGIGMNYRQRAPPKQLLIQVRMLRDCGKIQTTNGVLNLSQGSIHLLERESIETLIRTGNAEHID